MRREDLLASEKILQPPARRKPRRGVILFLQPYAVGMASLAVHVLYARLNASTNLVWERAFWPPAGSRPAQACSLESGLRLNEFDVIAVSSSYEVDWLSLPQALTAGGVAALRQDRKRGDGPLIIVGGPAISAAPLPLAALYDAAYIGEIEPALPALAEALAAERREEAWERLAAIPGCFVPELHRARAPGMFARRCAPCLDDFPTHSVILSPHTEFPQRFLVEIGRGCGRACRFCLARRLYQPLRWRSLAALTETIQWGLRHTNHIGLIAAAVSDYPDLADLCAALEALPSSVSVSISSLRIETASLELLRLLAARGQKTITFAPEAATERLRQAIGKPLPEEELFAGLERIVSAGLRRVRLYFMLGLPTEGEEDRAALPALARRMIQAFPQLRFHFSLAAFSPRPHTPFEAMPLAPLSQLRKWLGAAQRALAGLPRVNVTLDSPRWAIMQALLSRSDQRLGVALAQYQPQNLRELEAALAAVGLRPEALRACATAEDFWPWKIVQTMCQP